MVEGARSLLYVPGDRPERFAKARSSGADLTILDLEDAVTADRKATARAAVARYLAEEGSDGLCVRVDEAHLDADVVAVASLASAIVLPNVRMALLDRFAGLWQASGAPQPAVLGLIESAEGLAEVDGVARHPWVTRLGMGEADLAADMSVVVDDDRTQLWPYRALVVLHSRAAGLPSPVGPTDLQWNDESALAAGTERQRSQGFGGRTAVHPAQVATINRVFTVSERELQRAEAVLTEFHLRQKRGDGAFLGADGLMVDEATVRWARATLARRRPNS